MKRVKYISFLAMLLVLAGFYSCDDSLGYDPNVESTLLEKDINIEEPDTSDNSGNPDPELTVKIDSISYQFYETIRPGWINFDWKYSSDNDVKLMLDEEDRLYLQLSVKLNNTNTDRELENRYDYISYFEMDFMSEVKTTAFALDKGSTSNRWAYIEITKLPDSKYQYNGSTLRYTPILNMTHDDEKHIITCQIHVFLKKNYFHTEDFGGLIHVYYSY